MKKLLFVVSALAAFALLAPSSSFAQWENRVGIYTDPDAFATGSPELTVGANLPTFIYFVLTNPVNEGTPVANIEAFEFVCNADPLGTFFKLNESFNGEGLNVSSYPEYVVGFSSPVPVTGNQVLLMTWQVMVQSDAVPHKLYFALTQAPSITDEISYQDANGAQLIAMTPSSGSLAEAVFAINGTVISEETSSFGDVKALFR